MISKSARKFAAVVALAVSAMLGTAAHAGVIAQGNLLVYRVGSGTGSLLSTGNAVFIDEYTSTGVLVQSIPVPTTNAGANKGLISSGTASSEGLMNLSSDGNFIVFTGYNAAIPTTGLSSSAGTTVNRVVGVMNVTGINPTNAIDTTTALTDFASANNPRSVVSPDGNTFYVAGGAGGIRSATLGSTTSTQINTGTGGIATPPVNVRALTLTGSNLNFSTSSGTLVRIGQVGAGVPPVGNNTTALPGTPVSTGSPYQIAFANLSGGAVSDTLYIADDAGTIQKYSLISGTWVAKGSITAPAVRGLALSVNLVPGAPVVTLYGTTGGTAAAGGGSIYTFNDTTGIGGTITGAATTIATASANTAFRGIVYVPEPTSLALIGLGATGLLARRRRNTAK